MLPHKPVEREKVQKMLEAARISSFWGNVQALRAVVVERETASPEVLEKFLIPFFKNAMPQIKASGLTEFDCGQGVAQATLVAIDEGLGTAYLGTTKEEEIKKNLHLSDDSKLLVLMCVGYPADTREAGGQRPRLPFEELFSLNEVGNPNPRDPEVVEELRRAKLLQWPAPLPWRQQELEYLQRGLELPDF